MTQFHRNSVGRWCFGLLFLCGWMLSADLSSARANSEVNKELTAAAKTVAEFLKQRGDSSIAVGQFTGPARMPSSSGPSINKILSEQLVALGVTVSRKASLEIKGDYLALVAENKRGPAAILKGRILDNAGLVLLEFQQSFSQDITVAALFGLTVEIPPDASPREERKRLEESIKEPQANIQQTRVSAGPNSPFSVEELVKEGDKFVPRGVKDDEGLAFVAINKDEVYAVRVYNEAPFDVAVTLTIDGLNMFSFSDSQQYRSLGVFIIGAKSSGTIYGWHRNNQVSDSFLVTDYAKSAAAELKQSGGELGTITASFAAAWPEGSKPPPDEGLTRSEVATGRGAEVATNYKEVARHFGRMRSAVSVRYTK